MDAIEVYKIYFSSKYEDINYILNHYAKHNKIIAVWGGGARGEAFLQKYDPKCTKIHCVFDINNKKIGTSLQTGHLIADYKKKDVDIVLVMNNLYESEVIGLLQYINSKSQVINVDNIILGNKKKEQLLGDKEVIEYKVRKSDVAALFILYYCDESVVENILIASRSLKKIYVFDNTEEPNDSIVNKIKNIKYVEYFTKGKNLGLSVPINMIAQRAIKENIDWLVTFDQDSRPMETMLKKMLEYSESNMCTKDIGIIAPSIIDTNVKFGENQNSITFFDKVYQSGAMHNLKILKEINGYDENLFIDQVDYEYCIRLRLQGYKIVRLGQAKLIHNIEDKKVQVIYDNGKKIYIDKFSPSRYYYIYRNNLYCYEKYKEKDPIYALECENNIQNIKRNAMYDTNPTEKQEALKCALFDYENMHMGNGIETVRIGGEG